MVQLNYGGSNFSLSLRNSIRYDIEEQDKQLTAGASRMHDRPSFKMLVLRWAVFSYGSSKCVIMEAAINQLA